LFDFENEAIILKDATSFMICAIIESENLTVYLSGSYRQLYLAFLVTMPICGKSQPQKPAEIAAILG
jgi:hypothetical protein